MVTLWIVPSEEDTRRLKRIMNIRPVSSIASESSYPNFDPHITLAAPLSSSDIPLTKLRDCIPTSHPGLEIQFQSVEKGTHFFRSVYIAIKLTPELIALHEHVHKALNLEPRTPSFPHVSLCYISDEDAVQGEREKYYQELESSGRIRWDADGNVRLNCGQGTEEDWMAGFIAPEIWIADCVGPVEEWSVVEKIQLKA